MSNPRGINQYTGRSPMAQAQRNLTAANLREARRIIKSPNLMGVNKSVQRMQAEADIHHARSQRKQRSY